MNREIKFRGKRLNNSEWVYGCPGYGFNNKVEYIMPEMFFATRDFGEVDDNDNIIIQDTIAIGGFISVIPESVGQLTGLKDKNGVDIYEGDKLSKKWMVEVYKNIEGTYMVRFHNNPTINKPKSLYKYLIGREKAGTAETDCIIIGNIHENPELL